MKRGSVTISRQGKEPGRNEGPRTHSDSYFREFAALSEICLVSGYPHDCKNYLDPVLNITAVQIDLGRILILLKDQSGQFSIAGEWSREDLPSRKGMNSELNISTLPSLIPLLEDQKLLVADDTFKLPGDLQKLLETDQAGAVVITQLNGSENLHGVVLFENCPAKRHWTESQISLIKTVTGVIGKYFQCNSYNSSLLCEMQKAEKSSSARGDFITRISHEIRTPLNAIIGLSEALYYKVESDNNRRIVKSMISSGKLLTSLLNDVLELSKIDAGRLRIINERTDTTAILDDAEMTYHDVAARKNLDLIVERSISLPRYVMINERRTKQILFNLVTNAITFTRWGHIKVSADYISIEGKTGRLILRVADTGPGISEDKLNNIFEEYIQYENSKFYDEGSTGLGLALSKKLAVAMGGNIKAESHEGKGSVFTLVLPTEECDQKIVPANRKSLDFSEIKFPDSAILIIDDISTSIEIIENHTAETSLRVFSATGLDEALEKLSRNKIDLILMDHYMPVISGDEMVKMIRTKPELREIPVVAYTAASSAREHLAELDCYNDYLFKPITRENLFNLLTKFLSYETRNVE
jgi:signal transduction histidine kinase